MKVIGWIGILHVLVIVIWMVINIIFSLSYPLSINEEDSLASLGLEYYSRFPGYLGFDHGSKAFVMLLSLVLPIGVFVHFRNRAEEPLLPLIGLVTGCIGFSIYALSLMLQAVSVEYAFNLYRMSEEAASHAFATRLYEWVMLEGGLSVSMYILANVLLGCWVITSSIGWKKIFKNLSKFGWTVGVLLIIGHLLAWFFLMQGKQNVHLFNEAVGLLFLGWIFIISLNMIRGNLRENREE